jgi:hypothetical protein
MPFRSGAFGEGQEIIRTLTIGRRLQVLLSHAGGDYDVNLTTMRVEPM